MSRPSADIDGSRNYNADYRKALELGDLEVCFVDDGNDFVYEVRERKNGALHHELLTARMPKGLMGEHEARNDLARTVAMVWVALIERSVCTKWCSSVMTLGALTLIRRGTGVSNDKNSRCQSTR